MELLALDDWKPQSRRVLLSLVNHACGVYLRPYNVCLVCRHEKEIVYYQT